MRLTNFTDYSLRVLIFVAARPGVRATISDVARAFDISENHLTKVVHLLGRSGFLANVRGRGGGLELAMAARDINVADVVRKAEGEYGPAECFDADAPSCLIADACRLRGVLHEAMEAFYRVLGQYTLQDLVQQRAPLAKILFGPVRGQRMADRGPRDG
jgi:Rrf2 family transcriptional regulator, nitric oxide-sensitive transcriptional repressor